MYAKYIINEIYSSIFVG